MTNDIRELRERLLAKARLMCRNETDAEDLVQEAFCRLIQTIDKGGMFPNERACASWLITTFTHLFYIQCRKRRMQARWAKDPNLSDEAVIAQEPYARPVYDTLTDEQFAQAIQLLSPKLRATFELHAAGQKYQDIARLLGIEVGTVSKRLHDARTKLQKLLLRHPQVGQAREQVTIPPHCVSLKRIPHELPGAGARSV